MKNHVGWQVVFPGNLRAPEAQCREAFLCGGTEFSNVRFKGDDGAAAKVYEGTTPLTAEELERILTKED